MGASITSQIYLPPELLAQSNLSGELLLHLIDKYELKYFVETGTGCGCTAQLAAAAFETVYTIEIAPRHEALDKLKYFHNVNQLFGNSGQVIREVIPKLDKPTMYFLDSHWCGGERMGPECPLLEELEAIGGLGNRNIVLIDDARLFAFPPPPPHREEEWPKLVDIEALVLDWPGSCEMSIEGDTIILEPQSKSYRRTRRRSL